MDIRDFDESGHAPLHLSGPDGNPLFGKEGEPVFLYVFGRDSTARKAASNRLDFEKEKCSGSTQAEQEMRNKIYVEYFIDCLAGWSGIYDGENKFPFNRENAAKLLSRDMIAAQLLGFLGDRAAYFKANTAT
jgi:hypothetical protein